MVRKYWDWTTSQSRNRERANCLCASVRPLAEARRAHEHLEQGHVRGKIVLIVTEASATIVSPAAMPISNSI